MALPAAKLPSVMRVKLDAARTAEAAGEPTPVRTAPAGPTAVVSFTPGPRETPPDPKEEPLNLDRFAVGGHVEAAPETPPEEEPRTLTPEEEEAELQKKWKTEAPDLYHRYKTIAGMFERQKADTQGLKDQIKELKGDIEKLGKAPPAPAPEPKIVRPLEEELEEGTERETYKGSVPVIAKVSKRVASEIQEQIVAPLQAEIKELRTKIEGVSGKQVEGEEKAFFNRAKDYAKTRKISFESPDWKEYMSKKVPYSNFNVGQLMVAAHENRDFDSIKEIIHDFKPNGAAPSSDDLETPAVARVTQHPTVPKNKPMLKASERKKASADFLKGRMSKSDFSKIETLYKEAEVERRIDWNA